MTESTRPPAAADAVDQAVTDALRRAVQIADGIAERLGLEASAARPADRQRAEGTADGAAQVHAALLRYAETARLALAVLREPPPRTPEH